jgi:hypothetical protein
MNQLSIPNRVLRGEAERAALSLYRLKCEVERKYVKDSAGLSWVSKHLNQVSLFLDHIDRPLATATKLEETMSLRGLNGFNSDTVWKRLDVLIPLYLELLEAEGKAGQEPAQDIQDPGSLVVAAMCAISFFICSALVLALAFFWCFLPWLVSSMLALAGR